MANHTSPPLPTSPPVPDYDAIAAELETDREGDMFLLRRVEAACRRISWRVAIEVNDGDPGVVLVEIRGPGVEDAGFRKGAGFRLNADPEDTLDALTSIGEALIATARRARRFGLTAQFREVVPTPAAAKRNAPRRQEGNEHGARRRSARQRSG